MAKEFKIEIIHDETGEVVKRLEYSTESQRDRAYNGVIQQVNLGEYTVTTKDKP